MTRPFSVVELLSRDTSSRAKNPEAEIVDVQQGAGADDGESVGVVEGGKRFWGLGRNASYEAARAGQIPAVKIGGVWRIPIAAVAAMNAELGKDAAARCFGRKRNERPK